jgi:hypothetical protein
MSAPAPIILFTYNRPDHTRRTLEALAKNALARESELYVFCDGPRPGASQADIARIADVRRIVRERQWCGTVLIDDKSGNIGLAKSIRGGIDLVMETHDRAIILEDDIETSTGFLEYMNSALSIFEGEDKVMHISGYLPRTTFSWMLPEVFLTTHMSCWGWATWKRAWSKAQWDASSLLQQLDSSPGMRHDFDMGGTAGFANQLERNINGELRTWAIFWAASIYLSGGLCLMPRVPLVRNTGADGTGENFHHRTNLYDVKTGSGIRVRHIKPELSRAGRFYLRSFYKYGNDSGLRVRARSKAASVRHRFASRVKRMLRRP